MSKEFKIGLITIIAGGLLYYGFNFLRGSDLFSPTSRYYVYYPNVSGLNISNPVYFNGLPVGRVSGFKLQQEKSRIIVSMDIEEGVFVGQDAVASLANDGLFGGKAIILDVGKSSVPMEEGDTLKADTHGDLFSQFEPVADNLTTTLQDINILLDHLNNTDFPGLVDTLKYSVGSLTAKVNRLEVQPTIDSLTAMISSFKKRSDQLEGLMASSTALLDSLNQLPLSNTLRNLDSTLMNANNLLMAMQSEEGNLGKLMKDDSLYNNLNKVLLDLDQLILHFNNHPKDFMSPLGKKHKKLKGLPEEQ